MKLMVGRKAAVRRGSILLLAVLLAGSYVLYSLTQPLPALPAVPALHFSHRPQPVQLAWPGYGASAVGAVGYGVLAAHGSDAPLPTASVIKVLTALAVLDEKPLAPTDTGPLITITGDDIASYNKFVNNDGSVVRVQPGETLTERQALEALLLPSANNMAETLARWAFGSLGSYVTFANREAAELGMVHTVVTDPSGFATDTVSTPGDLVLLGEAGMSNPTIAQIVGEPTATIPVQGLVHNINFLLGANGVVGIKTGNNDGDTGCFLIAARQSVGGQKLTLVGVVMNAANLYTAMRDADTLITSAAKGFVTVTLASAGEAVAEYNVPWAGKVDAVAVTDLDMVVWSNSLTGTAVHLNTVNASAAAGTAAGTLTAYNSQSAVQPTTQLVLKTAVPAPSIWWRLVHPE